MNSVQTKRCIKTENILYITIPVLKFDLHYVRFKNIRIGITTEGEEGEREPKKRGEMLRSIILYEIEIACTDHYMRGKPVPPRVAYTSWSSSRQRASILQQHTRRVCTVQDGQNSSCLLLRAQQEFRTGSIK
jgi:hypothetical protein